MRRHLSTPYALLIGALALGGLAAVAHRSAADENAPAESTEPKAVEIDVNRELASHWGTIHDYLTRFITFRGVEETVAEELAFAHVGHLALVPVDSQTQSLLQESGYGGHHPLPRRF